MGARAARSSRPRASTGWRAGSRSSSSSPGRPSWTSTRRAAHRAAARRAPRASRTQADLDALARVVDATFDVAKAGDRRAFAAAATRVHETLVERAGNTTLAHVAMLLHELVAQYYVHVVQFHRVDEAVMSKAARSYRKLLSLIEAGDAEGAEAHWRRQMRFTIERSDTEAPVDLFEAAWT
ncbi:MAG: FCD domain-containing protein [Acidimicrobiia bacterium]|nr:FCD domain-containing protein [Acidimicrobiia bacterium]